MAVNSLTFRYVSMLLLALATVAEWSNACPVLNCRDFETSVHLWLSLAWVQIPSVFFFCQPEANPACDFLCLLFSWIALMCLLLCLLVIGIQTETKLKFYHYLICSSDFVTSDDSNLFNVQSLEELVLEKPSTNSKLSELTPTKEKRKIAEIEKPEGNAFSKFDHVNVCVCV